MPHSDKPESPCFKIRDGMGVLSCLVIGAVIIGLGSGAGLFSLTPVSLLLVGAIGQLVTIFVIVCLARRRGLRIHELIIGKNAWWREAVLGVVGAIVLWAIAIGLWLAGLIPISDRLSVLILETSLPVRLAFFAMAVVLAPIAEELLYRGALQGGIHARFNIYCACLVQAALFAAMHQKSLAVMLTIFVGGLTYGMIVYWRNSLFASMVTHATFNAVGAGWLVLLFWLNAHNPAANMTEAQSPPSWLLQAPAIVPRERFTAAEQFELVVQRFGSQGLQLWKAEIQGLDQVRRRFPDDHPYAAKSMVAIQEIYLLYLNDPRRAVTAGQELIDRYPGEREFCARAVIMNARACQSLGDAQLVGEWIRHAEDSYADITGIQVKVDALKQRWASE
ncbi:MAG: type II CAAX endopeptidase family protein [Fuerstiella sp.]|nr:type II CAAX endopeptidase family protein [Fuerstiella sp.]